MTETSYDQIAYPSHAFATTSPDRLAAVAALHGIAAVDPRTARILEIGGGDGVNLMAIAAAFPGCEAHNFDLSHAAIERGEKLRQASGLSNVTLAVEDIHTAAARYPAASFDYVIAHGVLAWVPEPVRLATLALIRHALAPNGVAFVSYNALPGAHMRLVMREMLWPEIAGIADPQERLNQAMAILQQFAGRPAPDDSLAKAMHAQARNMLERAAEGTFHDELNEFYEPQGLLDVVREAGSHDLVWLSEADSANALEGLVRGGAALEDDPDLQVVREAFRSDYRNVRYFRQSILVRRESSRARAIDGERAAPLYCSVAIKRLDDGQFVGEDRAFRIADAGLNEWLSGVVAMAADIGPRHRFSVTELARTPKERIALLELAQVGVTFFAAPAPYVTSPSERPEASRLVRGQIALGVPFLSSLAHEEIELAQADVRALLAAADGTRTVEELEAVGSGIEPTLVRNALEACARIGLLRA